MKFRIEFIMVEKSNQKKLAQREKTKVEFRDTALRNAGSWSRKRRQQETTHETKVH